MSAAAHLAEIDVSCADVGQMPVPSVKTDKADVGGGDSGTWDDLMRARLNRAQTPQRGQVSATAVLPHKALLPRYSPSFLPAQPSQAKLIDSRPHPACFLPTLPAAPIPPPTRRPASSTDRSSPPTPWPLHRPASFPPSYSTSTRALPSARALNPSRSPKWRRDRPYLPPERQSRL